MSSNRQIYRPPEWVGGSVTVRRTLNTAPYNPTSLSSCAALPPFRSRPIKSGIGWHPGRGSRIVRIPVLTRRSSHQKEACPILFEMLSTNDREVAMENSVKPGPLDGVRVLDLGHYIAIPILTRMMADLVRKLSRLKPRRMATLRDLPRLSRTGTAAALSSTIAANKASAWI
jgi:hypothetical protein